MRPDVDQRRTQGSFSRLQQLRRKWTALSRAVNSKTGSTMMRALVDIACSHGGCSRYSGIVVRQTYRIVRLVASAGAPSTHEASPTRPGRNPRKWRERWPGISRTGRPKAGVGHGDGSLFRGTLTTYIERASERIVHHTNAPCTETRRAQCQRGGLGARASPRSPRRTTYSRGDTHLVSVQRRL